MAKIIDGANALIKPFETDETEISDTPRTDYIMGQLRESIKYDILHEEEQYKDEIYKTKK